MYKPSFQLKSTLQSESDPFHIIVVEDLLKGINDWRNIQDIIRTTFKALTTVLKSQSDSIIFIDKEVQQKITKQDISNDLSSKANQSEIQKQMQELSSQLEKRIQQLSVDSLQLGKDYMQRQERDKQTYQELNRKIDEMSNQIIKDQQDIQILKQQMILKADQGEVTDQLEQKVNKSSLSAAMSKKVSKSDLDQLLYNKIDQVQFQQALEQIELKVNQAVSKELVEKLIEPKVDKLEMESNINEILDKLDNQGPSEIKLTLQSLQNEIALIKQEGIKNNGQILSDLENVKLNLYKKIDSKDVDKLVLQLNQKLEISEQKRADLTQLKDEMYNTLTQLKKDYLENEEEEEKGIRPIQSEDNSKLEETITEIRQDILKVNERINQLYASRNEDQQEFQKQLKLAGSNIGKEAKREQDRLEQDYINLRREMDELHKFKMSQQDFDQFKQSVITVLGDKADFKEVQDAFNNHQADITKNIEDMKTEINNNQQIFQNEMVKNSIQKASIDDIYQLIEQKADTNSTQVQIQDRFEKFKQTLQNEEISNIYQQLEGKLDLKQQQDNMQAIYKQLEYLKKEVANKVNSKDVDNLIGQKINQEQLTQFQEELKKEIEQKVNKSDFKKLQKEQSLVNDSLCSENIVGRWTWKSGELKPGSLIPWEIQVSNTLPNNFLWEKDKANLTVVASGLYELNCGFYSKKQVSFQLLVNNEPVFQYCEKSTQKQVIKHQIGHVSGLSVNEFLILPPKTRISFIYSGEAIGEGFFGLKRLQ